MAKISKTEASKILAALASSGKKYMTLEDLSKLLGYYPDAIAAKLVDFAPMVMMDPSLNLREIEPSLRDYIAEEDGKASRRPKRIIITKKEVSQYSSIADFVFLKMTGAGGLVDRSTRLSDIDLGILRKLVADETKRRKSERRKKNKK